MSDAIKSAYFYHRDQRRLASAAIVLARADVAAGRSRYGSVSYGNNQQGFANARGSDGAVWIESLDAAGLRFVGYADKLARIGHNGWYTSDDNDRDEILRGAVLQLPGRNGRPLYLAAYEDPNNAGAYRVDVSEVFEGSKADAAPEVAQRNAARAADSLAERNAEEEREYNRAWQAGRRFEDLAEEVARIRKGLLALIAEAKAACEGGTLGPAIRATIAEKLASGRATINKAYASRADLLADFGKQPGWEG